MKYIAVFADDQKPEGYDYCELEGPNMADLVLECIPEGVDDMYLKDLERGTPIAVYEVDE